MEVSDLPKIVAEHLVDMGAPGFVIAALLLSVWILWRALQQERERTKDLVALMFGQSKETAIIIERISGR